MSISDEMIKSLNERTAKVVLNWNFIVDNSHQISDNKIAENHTTVVDYDNCLNQ